MYSHLDNQSQKLVKCPYDRNHVIPENKILFHVSSGCATKLKVQHKYDSCPYNYIHIFLKEMMYDHVEQCPDNPKVQQRRKQMDLKKQGLPYKNVEAEEDELQKLMQQAIKEQFSSKSSQQDQQIIDEHNQNVPGLDASAVKVKKKRIRGKKPQEEVVEQPKEEDNFPEPNFDFNDDLVNLDQQSQILKELDSASMAPIKESYSQASASVVNTQPVAGKKKRRNKKKNKRQKLDNQDEDENEEINHSENQFILQDLSKQEEIQIPIDISAIESQGLNSSIKNSYEQTQQQESMFHLNEQIQQQESDEDSKPKRKKGKKKQRNDDSD